MKHTPGPWKPFVELEIHFNSEGDKFTERVMEIVDEKLEDTICYVPSRHLGNPSLIAAVPLLLEALQFVQLALAEWRDGSDEIEHPKHGKINLEEVKYLVVDEAISAATT